MDADAVFQGPDRIEQVGHEQQVHDEARIVLGRHRLLAEAPARRRAPGRRSRGLVVTVRTTSTSCISGTGLKKWSPTNRSARLVAAAIAAMVRLEVFEAKIVCAGQRASSSFHSVVLDVEILGDRLDHDVAVLQRRDVGGEAEAAQGGVAVGRRRACPSRRTCRATWRCPPCPCRAEAGRRHGPGSRSPRPRRPGRSRCP